ncbi:hypothetical protein HDU97_004887 [Phlyctochytrium planicorne]|nr:hypothetical protein HDU97_004887 [Phlyctochytrium planicorne]
MSSDVPASCCTLAPVKQNYTPKGEVVKVSDPFDGIHQTPRAPDRHACKKFTVNMGLGHGVMDTRMTDGIRLGDMNLYLTGSKGAKNAIVIHYDIFGDHENTRQVADILSTHGFRVAMPDLLRGDPWPTSQWPPESIEKVFGHILGVAPYEKVTADLTATIDYLKKEGSEKFGTVGFCWGGRNIGLLSGTGLFDAAALVHPGFFEPSELENAKNPIAFFPAMDDKSFQGHVDVLKKNPKFAPFVFQHHFTDVSHGFCASRSDFSDELIGKRANECIKEIHNFFTDVFAAKL